MTDTTTTFRVWIQLAFTRCGPYEERVAKRKIVGDLKSAYEYSRGKLNGRDAWVFFFPDSETAYDWQYKILFETQVRFGKDILSYGQFFTFEDNFDYWRCHKDRFISNEKNSGYHFYKIWKGE